MSAVFSLLGSPLLLCVVGSRMFFNLKEAAEHGVNSGTNWSSYPHSAILFEEPQSECVTDVLLVGTVGT